jgi:hypothetical protein
MKGVELRTLRARRLSSAAGFYFGLLAVSASAFAAQGEALDASDATTDTADDSAAASPDEGDGTRANEPKPSDSTALPPFEKVELDAAMRAYQKALEKKGLGAGERLTREAIGEELRKIEEKLSQGRRDEAIADLVYLVENPRFDAFRKLDEGRAAAFLLGDALGSAGAVSLARKYFAPLLAEPKNGDLWFRRAVRSLVDLGLEYPSSAPILEEIGAHDAELSEELRSDRDYLAGRHAERSGKPAEALRHYAKVTPRGRFWAQANYLSGLIEVSGGRFKEGEAFFCKVADPKVTPKQAAVFGGNDFFQVRDMSRLALGRVAHEQYRFDDSRYYYYLVPHDSDRLPEALYESATSRYEAKDYDGARELVDELNALERSHVYEDEVYIFDAYVDLASCEFATAEAKLKKFMVRYGPVRDTARRLARDPKALVLFVDAIETNADPANSGVGAPPDVARSLAMLLRVDPSYGAASRKRAEIEHQLSGLGLALDEMSELERRISNPKEVMARKAEPLSGSRDEKLERLKSEVSEVSRLLRDARGSSADPKKLEPLERELETLQLKLDAATAARAVANRSAGKADSPADLALLLKQDRRRAQALVQAAEVARARLEKEQLGLARDALERLDKRMSRLLRRARLGRVETVLGKKRALEVEIEALSQGLLPRDAVDSLDAARYLQDDEEYWPFDGEDWEDEYVGGEGLR